MKLGPSKTAKIKISHGDNPQQVAQNFGKIYSLDSAAREVLVTVIRQSMEQSGIIINELDAPTAESIASEHGESSSISSHERDESVHSKSSEYDDDISYHGEVIRHHQHHRNSVQSVLSEFL